MNITLKSFFNTQSRFPLYAAKTFGAFALGGGAYYLGKSYTYNPSIPTKYTENCLEAVKKANQEQGKLQVDLPRLVTTMGASMYGSSIVEVAVKELLQNAFDTVKEAVYKGLIQEGDIKLFFDNESRTITIEDNGMGMSPEIIQKAFFTIGSSHKDMPPHLCSGGYGQAKIAFLLSVEKIHISSTQNGIRTEITTTPSELLNSYFNISTHPDAKTKPGTKIKVWIPNKDSKGNEIYFPYLLSSCSTLDNPLIGPTKITASSRGNKQVLPLGTRFNKSVYANVTFDWGTATVYFDSSEVDKYFVKHSILSSGVFQFNYEFKRTYYEKIPHNIIIDIKPNIAPDHPNYPFTNNRENFRNQVSGDIEKLRAYLVTIQEHRDNQKWTDTFSSSKCMETSQLWHPLVKERSPVNVKKDPPANKNKMTSMLYSLFGKGSDVVIRSDPKIRTDKPITLSKLETTPCKGPIFVNSMNPRFSVEDSDLEMRQFFFELASIFSIMKDAIAKSGMPKYHTAKEYHTGIGILKDAHGINMHIPVRAILLNPLNPVAQTTDGICRNLMTTMIHELAHIEEESHGVEHNQAMKAVESYLADQGILEDVQAKLKALLTQNKAAFKQWQQKFNNALKDSDQNKEILKGCR